ncbi:MAG: hypothetical protein LBK00_03590, partial [Treponema sp.]|nr:hypothetical protein [Treponema sp.]
MSLVWERTNPALSVTGSVKSPGDLVPDRTRSAWKGLIEFLNRTRSAWKGLIEFLNRTRSAWKGLIEFLNRTR